MVHYAILSIYRGNPLLGNNRIMASERLGGRLCLAFAAAE